MKLKDFLGAMTANNELVVTTKGIFRGALWTATITFWRTDEAHVAKEFCEHHWGCGLIVNSLADQQATHFSIQAATPQKAMRELGTLCDLYGAWKWNEARAAEAREEG
jgi:hypothetical protein